MPWDDVARAAARAGEWRLLRGEERVGDVREYAVDQPFFLCRCIPGPGWGAVRPLFGAWADVRGPGPDGSRTARAIRPLRELRLTPVPDEGGPALVLFDGCVLRIDGTHARLRR
ncbi:hypothetical protein AB0J38_32455 [Streptomyces sp. NPDC050095]|uniref:hypothetical protein n=1 Tax=unclassified Streptomyces TaxID=2593676 RepID=UPI0034165B77